jgi:hypothetical protein
METTTRGRCLCGAVTWEYDGEERFRLCCHCESCRRATSSPFTSYLGISYDRFRWTGEAPRTYESSPGVTRSFCGTCGSPMGYESPEFPQEIHLFVASAEDPAALPPMRHVNWSEHLPWIILADGLPTRG